MSDSTTLVSLKRDLARCEHELTEELDEDVRDNIKQQCYLLLVDIERLEKWEQKQGKIRE
jgi:hypothetical protein